MPYCWKKRKQYDIITLCNAKKMKLMITQTIYEFCYQNNAPQSHLLWEPYVIIIYNAWFTRNSFHVLKTIIHILYFLILESTFYNTNMIIYKLHEYMQIDITLEIKYHESMKKCWSEYIICTQFLYVIVYDSHMEIWLQTF